MVFNTTLEMPDEFGNASDGTDTRSNSVEIPSISGRMLNMLVN